MIKKLRIVGEIIFLYALLVGVNWFFFPYDPVWIDVDPHPYWIGIFLFAYRYGLPFGFITGALSCVLYIIYSFKEVDSYLLDDASFFVLPVLFVVVGLLIGLVSNKQQKKQRLLQEREENLKSKIKVQDRELEVAREINQALEKRIVTRMSTLVTLYSGAHKLESVYLDELYPAIVDFIAKSLEASTVSLYLRKGDNWYLKTKIGFQDYQKIPELIGLKEGLIGLAGTEGRIVTVRDFLGEGQSLLPTQVLGDCLFAGPIKGGDASDTQGVVAVHKIPFLNFNSSTLTLFKLLLGWTSTALSRAYLFDEMRNTEIIDPDLRVYSNSHFRSRLEQEFARSKKYFLPLSFIVLKMPGLSKISQARQRVFLRVMSHFLRINAREIDVVGCYNEAEMPLAILLVTTSEKQAVEELRRLNQLYQRFSWPQLEEGWKGKIEFILTSFRPEDASLSDMLNRVAT